MGDPKAVICLACEADTVCRMYDNDIAELKEKIKELEEDITEYSEAQPPI